MARYHNKLHVAEDFVEPIKMTLVILERTIDNLLGLLATVDIDNLDLLCLFTIWHILIGEEVVLEAVYNALWQLGDIVV